MSDLLGIYIHIPFCVRKCYYCDFCSFPPLAGVQNYTQALISDIRKHGSIRADTLYVGGGTPTYIPSDLLCQVISEAVKSFGLDGQSEISVECNPGTADISYFRALHRCGVNRLSIGMQSANADELSALGRIHDFEQTKKAVHDARTAGFENINLDLMYGIPHQTPQSFTHSLKQALSLSPEHISAYALKVEDGTEFYKRIDELPLPDEDTVCDMLDGACEILQAHGLHRYEISNFAKSGYECRHNIKYWRCTPYLAFGSSASGYYGDVRYTFNRSLGDYTDYANGKKLLGDVLSERVEISDEMCKYEYVMLGLRMTQGISDSEYKEKFGVTFTCDYGRKLDKYIRLGLAEHNGDTYRLTDKGMLVSNTILSELL